jgi:hypothetical protein
MFIKQSISIFLILLLISLIASAQTDSSLYNSFESIYKKRNPTLNYKYDREKQIHDYSNNWDLDNDNKPDQIYFVGTGGAHLYYFLRVILSSDNITRDFSFIESDFPVLPADEELKNADFKPNDKTLFAVFDDGSDNTKDIYVKLDEQSFYAAKKELKKKGVKTKQILISFKKRKTIFKDLVNPK